MSTNSHHFSKADKNDISVILTISKDIITNYYASFLGEDITDNYINSKQYEKEIFDNMESCIVMKLENTHIGFSITIENKLHLMMIDRKYQNNRYGTYLLRHTENILFEKYSTIELQSFTHNTIANQFYTKNGWIKNEEATMGGILLNKYSKNKMSITPVQVM
jgi:GNAT superfamily N-acetyltransferase